MPEITESRYLVKCGWADIPHLSERAKKEIRDGTLPHLRDSVEHGDPSMGAGAIYPIPLSEVLAKPFVIPAFWPRAYAMDVGWKRTAVLWGAWDQSNDTLYCYTEHYRGQAEPSIHATAVKARGAWIPGAIDPAARGRSQRDGEQLMATYLELGLDLTPAINAVEAGIWAVFERLSTGRLKFFDTLMNLQSEYRLYRRDENGKIVKAHDHLMDCLRYLTMSGRAIARTEPIQRTFAAGRPGPADRIAGY